MQELSSCVASSTLLTTRSLLTGGVLACLDRGTTCVLFRGRGSGSAVCVSWYPNGIAARANVKSTAFVSSCFNYPASRRSVSVRGFSGSRGEHELQADSLKAEDGGPTSGEKNSRSSPSSSTVADNSFQERIRRILREHGGYKADLKQVPPSDDVFSTSYPVEQEQDHALHADIAEGRNGFTEDKITSLTLARRIEEAAEEKRAVKRQKFVEREQLRSTTSVVGKNANSTVNYLEGTTNVVASTRSTTVPHEDEKFVGKDFAQEDVGGASEVAESESVDACDRNASTENSRVMERLTDTSVESFPRFQDTFVDKLWITVRSGDGGNPEPGTYRKFSNHGGPAYGGHGADVWIKCTRAVLNLNALPRVKKARNGGDGGGGGHHTERGRNQKAETLHVPVGTIVRERKLYRAPESNEPFRTEEGKRRVYLPEFVYQFLQHGDQIRICKGGKGGIGPSHFRLHDGRKGAKGEKRMLELEYRVPCDVCLLGFPNSGKTALAAALTRAHTRIGPEAFSTTRPHTGVLKFKDGVSLRVLDLPGLLHGAADHPKQGRRVLRHTYRARVLVFVVDMSRKPNIDTKPTAISNSSSTTTHLPAVFGATKSAQLLGVEQENHSCGDLWSTEDDESVHPVPAHARIADYLRRGEVVVQEKRIREELERNRRLRQPLLPAVPASDFCSGESVSEDTVVTKALPVTVSEDDNTADCSGLKMLTDESGEPLDVDRAANNILSEQKKCRDPHYHREKEETRHTFSHYGAEVHLREGEKPRMVTGDENLSVEDRNSILDSLQRQVEAQSPQSQSDTSSRPVDSTKTARTVDCAKIEKGDESETDTDSDSDETTETHRDAGDRDDESGVTTEDGFVDGAAVAAQGVTEVAASAPTTNEQFSRSTAEPAHYSHEALDAFQQFLTLRREAIRYDPLNAEKPFLIVGTKCDRLHEDALYNLDSVFFRWRARFGGARLGGNVDGEDVAAQQHTTDATTATGEDKTSRGRSPAATHRESCRSDVMGVSARFGLGIAPLARVLRSLLENDALEVRHRDKIFGPMFPKAKLIEAHEPAENLPMIAAGTELFPKASTNSPPGFAPRFVRGKGNRIWTNY
ncbi:unnamed protein product [Amoebophrya sp. A120]|nr:unnamed protein product [Amoebophrya sp. A120]|eukprot:GSA120T00001913001.1